MNPKELIKLLEKKLSESPSNPEVKEQLAFLLLAQGNLSKAETLFNEVIKLNPKSSNSLWGLAKIHWQNNAYDKAYSCMNLLSSIPDAKLNKEQALIFAKILAQRSSFKEASRWLDVAIAQDSSLLQSEISFLKFIRQNLPIKQKKSYEDRFSNEGVATQDASSLPIRQSHYIVLEISQLLGGGAQGQVPSQAMQDLQLPEHERADLNQVQKITTLDQVGGLKKVKQLLIQDVVLPLKNPQLCSMYGKTSNPKVLLYGPPGCGKTHLCRALAAESEINFLPIKASDFLDLSFEEAEMKLYHLIQYARDCRPSIIFLDEFLWLSHNRDAGFGDNESFFYRSNLLNTLLESLNGNFSMNNQVGVIVTTNAPWMIDPQFLSTNKIDKHLFINPPTFEERMDILSIVLESKRGPVLEEPAKIDTFKVIQSLMSNVRSGADIEKLVDYAMSDLLVDTVANVQSNSSEDDNKSEQKELRLMLTTERLIQAGRNLKLFPSTKLWVNEAKAHLKPNRNLNFLWSEVQKYTPMSLLSKIKLKLQDTISLFR